ncbi:hypothetical protein ANCCAN_23633 [Ancylostoma caninum]|uniref:DUF1279 domain-containing protein n=1 Tax=Ancylostoma caninum TaxID=29170 RepID=A0A368FEI9_ANCCA|nr:hypothetical protein ANCCAN_23633 [Ancylostoma caninum]
MLLFWRCARSSSLPLSKLGQSYLPISRLGQASILSYNRACYYSPHKLSSTFHRTSAALHTTSSSLSDEKEKERSRWPFHMTMTEAQKEEKKQKIKQMKEEEEPKSLFGKIKYYLKRYWYIAVPAHMVSSTLWFGGLYALVHLGVDVVAFLRFLHVPAIVIEKIENVPPSAGAVVVALLLYKVATPLRYTTTLVLIQAAFWTLRRMGKLRTAREVEFKMRTEYEKSKLKYGRKLYRFRHLGVRDVSRKSSQGQIRRDSSDQPERKD